MNLLFRSLTFRVIALSTVWAVLALICLMPFFWLICATLKNNVADKSVRNRCGVPVTWRIALSTWLPNDWPP